MRPLRSKMKDRFAQRIKIGLLSAFVLLPLSVSAVTYDSQTATTTHAAQIRVEGEFTKKFDRGLSLELSEELRFDVYNSTVGPSFRKSYTSLTFAYKPIDYLKLDIGYTLKVLGPNASWSATKKANPNKYFRHRVYLSATGMYKFQYAKLYLRERLLMEARQDSINPLEKNRCDLELRSKLGAEFYIPGKPVKPYLWAELINTLNAPLYQQRNGAQFINNVRTQAGVKWRLTKMSSLDFYYRFTYGYDRDINITKNKGYIQLTEQTLFLHAVGIAYNLDW